MLSLFLRTTLSIPGLPLSDAYHWGYANPSAEYWVQGNKKASIVIILPKNLTINLGLKMREYDASNFTDIKNTVTTRGNEKDPIYSTITLEPGTDKPFVFKITVPSTKEEPFMIMYTHNAPVYRLSAALGGFTLFIALFLFVFGWAIFCGACRATRKR